MKHPVNHVVFDAPKLARLKTAYATAVESNVDTFTFEDHEYLTAYTKYLIEYLELRSNKMTESVLWGD